MSRNINSLEEKSNKDDIKRKILEAGRKELLASFDLIRLNCELNDKQLYYDNQETTANVVATTILEHTDVVFQLIVAMTQTGKTGCMVAVVEKCIFAGCDMKINPKNVFIVTGLSSNDWREQTKDRVPDILEKNVFHRGELKKLANRIGDASDVLVLMDEVHIAAKENMSIDKMLKDLGFKDMSVLRDRNINFVVFSATPNGILNDMNQWGDKYTKKLVMQPGVGYKGIREMIVSNRVFEAQDLYIEDEPDSTMTFDEREKRLNKIKPAMDNIKSLKKHIIEAYNTPKYHIIRTPSGLKADVVMNRFREVFGREGFRHLPCNSKSDESEVQTILENEPKMHTLIYIKEHLRCAVTLSPKNRIGVLYERKPKVLNDDVIVQGLAGRATGYDVPEDLIVYTNKDSLEKYMKAWDNGFESIGDMTFQGSRAKKQKKTFTHPTGYQNHDVVVVEESNEEQEPVIKKFSNFNEAKDYAKNVSGKQGPHLPKKYINSDGFYECNIRGIKKVWDVDEMYRERKCNIKNGAHYGFRYCYEDINDKSTLQFWIIHY